jgi:peptide/nickel transport system substrate-binding protein
LRNHLRKYFIILSQLAIIIVKWYGTFRVVRKIPLDAARKRQRCRKLVIKIVREVRGSRAGRDCVQGDTAIWWCTRWGWASPYYLRGFATRTLCFDGPFRATASGLRGLSAVGVNRQLDTWRSLPIVLAILLCVLGCERTESRHKPPLLPVASTGAAPLVESPSIPDGGIVTGVIGDASVLLPVLAADAPSRDVAYLIFNGLVKYDKDAKLVGDLAAKWEMSDDCRRIRFHLRPDVKWQDGEPFTSRDVAYTYRVYADPKTPTPWASDYLRVAELRCLDDHTVDITYDKPYAPALESWNEGILPCHLLEGQSITASHLQRCPIGTGPFRFESWNTGEKIVLSANPCYFEGRPHIPRTTIRIIPDTATMFLLLKAGEIDRMDLSPIQYARQTQSNWFCKNFQKYKYLHLGYTYLGYNLKDPRFQDKRVRQALSMAIDRQRIVKCVLLGLGEVAHTTYKPDSQWYNPRVKKFPYDPDKARQLLEEAGWSDTDGDGLLDKDGQQFTFTILTNQGNDLRKNAAILIQNDLKKIGIGVRIRVVEWAALLKHFIHKRDFDACLLGWRTSIDPNQADLWHSSKTCDSCVNFISYANPEVDALLEAGASTFDVQERKQYYDKFQEIIAEDQPCTFLWVQHDLPIVNARFRGVQPAVMGIDYNFAQWYVPEQLQRCQMEP